MEETGKEEISLKSSLWLTRKLEHARHHRIVFCEGRGVQKLNFVTANQSPVVGISDLLGSTDQGELGKGLCARKGAWVWHHQQLLQ